MSKTLQVHTVPDPFRLSGNRASIFLAGSIEQGAAARWQDEVIVQLLDTDLDLLNPRRHHWDATWPQRADFAPFREQVEWELKAMHYALWIAMYFDPATVSPITLLELGLYARSGKLIVCCPDGYARKGNVDILCKQYNVDTVATLDELIGTMRELQDRSITVAEATRRYRSTT